MNDWIMTNNDAPPSQMSLPSTPVFNFLIFCVFYCPLNFTIILRNSLFNSKKSAVPSFQKIATVGFCQIFAIYIANFAILLRVLFSLYIVKYWQNFAIFWRNFLWVQKIYTLPTLIFNPQNLSFNGFGFHNCTIFPFRIYTSFIQANTG